MYRTEQLAGCPVCDSSQSHFWLAGSDQLLHIAEETFPYHACENCGAYFLLRRPTEATVAAFYPEHYGPYASGEDGAEPGGATLAWRIDSALRKLSKAVAAHRAHAREIERFYDFDRPQPGTLLDFGCGSGEFLDRAAERGWQTIGMDFSSTALERAGRRGHRALPVGTEGWASLKPASVDVVRMNHVLEHLYAPVDVLAQIRRLLVPGGRLHVAVPNPVGWSARRYGSDWMGLDCPRHVILYSPATLRELLARLGFEVVALVPDLAPKDVLRSHLRWRRRDPEDPRALLGARLRGLWITALGRLAARGEHYDRYHLLATAAPARGAR